MKHFIHPFNRKYAQSEGRTSRRIFLYFMVCHILCFVITVGLDLLMIIYLPDSIFTGYFSLIYALVSFLPVVCIMIRRLHDTGKSGWLSLLFLIPLIGIILSLILLLKKGDAGTNRFGSVPADFA